MRRNFARKTAIALAAVAGSAGLSMAAPVAAHAEEPATVQAVQDPSLSESVTLESAGESTLYEARPKVVARASVDLGGGCTQYFIFFSDGSHVTYVRCVVIIQG